MEAVIQKNKQFSCRVLLFFLFLFSVLFVLTTMFVCSFWVTVRNLLSPVKLVASSIPTDG